MNREVRPAFDARPGRQVRHALIGFDEFRPAIRVTRIVERVHAHEDVGAFQHLRPRQREGKKDGVARGNIRNRDAVPHLRQRTRFRYRNIRGECRAAERIERDSGHHMPRRAEAGRHTASGV